MVSVGMVGSPTEGDENRVQATASTRKQRLGRRSQSPIFEGVPGFCALPCQCLNRRCHQQPVFKRNARPCGSDRTLIQSGRKVSDASIWF
jgi:hypothetical protein